MAMHGIPNVHLLGVLIAAFTLTYRVRALIPIYVFVILYGLFFGILTMLPFIYIWLPLWGMFMIAGKITMPLPMRIPVYMVLCALHGLSFGTLYAPLSALLFGYAFNLQTMLAWIAAGLPFDITHAISNFTAGILIVPLHELLKKLNRRGNACVS